MEMKTGNELEMKIGNETQAGNELEMNSDIIIEFRAISTLPNNEEVIEGFMNLEEVDDEKPLQFYDHNGIEIGYNFPSNPYQEHGATYNEYIDWEQLKTSLQYDDQVIQFLVDFATESKTITREDYILEINGGDSE